MKRKRDCTCLVGCLCCWSTRRPAWCQHTFGGPCRCCVPVLQPNCWNASSRPSPAQAAPHLQPHRHSAPVAASRRAPNAPCSPQHPPRLLGSCLVATARRCLGSCPHACSSARPDGAAALPHSRRAPLRPPSSDARRRGAWRGSGVTVWAATGRRHEWTHHLPPLLVQASPRTWQRATWRACRGR